MPQSVVSKCEITITSPSKLDGPARTCICLKRSFGDILIILNWERGG